MENKTRTELFLSMLTENRTTEARRLLGHAEYELSKLPSNLGRSQKSVVKEINVIIARLNEGYDGSAIAKAKPALANFIEFRMNSFIKNFLTKNMTRYYDPSSGRGDSYVDIPSHHQRRRVVGWQNIMSDFSQKKASRKETKDLWTIEGILEAGEDAELEQERLMLAESKINKVKNDYNTPTLVAQRFTDLYNNEWTEAFRKLSQKKMYDRTIIELLLEIAQQAYMFCKKEAERQLQDIYSAFLDILEFGSRTDHYRQRSEESSVLAKYRKDMAATALPRLIKEFHEKTFKEICVAKLGVEPEKDGIGSSFARRTVEVIWWMCVQDPPVYMVPTSKESFDPKLYNAYSKTSSNQPLYFVWPALRFSQSGEVLQKGIVQYR